MLLERRRPLDESLLWQWERRYYAEAGTSAWTSGTVPWRITSTPRLAEAFAAVLASWAADLATAGRREAGTPLVVLDLGAGTGRLGFLLAQALEAAGVPHRLVLADASRSTLDALRAHPQLAPLFAAGHLDVAQVDALSPGPLALEVSGERWDPGALPGPLAVVGTYLFDSLPQQLWRRHRGRLERGLVTLAADEVHPRLEDVRWRFDFEAAPAPSWLEGARASHREHPFLVPTGPLACLDGLARLAGGPLLALVVDKGPRTEAQGRGVPFPGLARHGCVSASVNFELLRAAWGWRPWLEPRTPSDALGTYGLARGLGARSLSRTAAAFAAHLGENQPLAELAALDGVAPRAEHVTPEELLTLLARTGGSPDAFLRLAPLFRRHAPTLPRDALLAAVAEVWRHHFELGETGDVAFELATVCQRAGLVEVAAQLYGRSALSRGAHPTTLLNLALCQLDLGREAEGRALLGEVLAREPEHTHARAVLARLDGQGDDVDR